MGSSSSSPSRVCTAQQIEEIVRLYDRFERGERRKVVDNADFGYARVTVERPLRLTYRMSTEAKERLLDACPHLAADVEAIDAALGCEPLADWSTAWQRIQDLLHERRSRWKQTEQKLFRSGFTEKDPKAAPVRKHGRAEGYEPNPDLRAVENVPLKEDIDAYFEREVHPHFTDAWVDRRKDKVGYEINFNRHFLKYTPPRPLAEIDADLKKAEQHVLRVLREVTE